MVITGMQAMQLAKGTSDASRRQSGNATQQSQGGASQSLSMSQAEATMKHLVDEGWFEKSRRGFYSLSPRGLMELRGYLVETYNGENDDGRWVNKIKYCAACGDIVTVVSFMAALLRYVTAIFLNDPANASNRASAVVTVIVVVASMIFARAITSGCSRQRSARSAGKHGLEINLWAKRPSPQPNSISKETEGALTPSAEATMDSTRKL